MKKLKKLFNSIKQNRYSIYAVLAFIIIFIFCMLLSFEITGVIVRGICWAFGWQFSWKKVLGIWLVMGLLGNIFSAKIKLS